MVIGHKGGPRTRHSTVATVSKILIELFFQCRKGGDDQSRREDRGKKVYLVITHRRENKIKTRGQTDIVNF